MPVKTKQKAVKQLKIDLNDNENESSLEQVARKINFKEKEGEFVHAIGLNNNGTVARPESAKNKSPKKGQLQQPIIDLNDGIIVEVDTQEFGSDYGADSDVSADEEMGPVQPSEGEVMMMNKEGNLLIVMMNMRNYWWILNLEGLSVKFCWMKGCLS